MQPIHDRMPVIVPPDQYRLWLDPTVKDKEKLADVLKPYPAAMMEAHPVSRVNSPQNDDAGLLERD